MILRCIELKNPIKCRAANSKHVKVIRNGKTRKKNRILKIDPLKTDMFEAGTSGMVVGLRS